MAKVRGGDARQFIISGREFDPKAENSPTIILPGFIKENMPTGNGSMHTNAKRKLGGVDSAVVSIDALRQDQEFLQALADKGEDFPFSVTLASGVTYSGSGQFEGDLNFASNDGQLEFGFRSTKFEQLT